MEKRIINPWGYQDILDFMPAVEIENQQGTLFGCGQAAMSAESPPSSGDMPSRLAQANRKPGKSHC